MISLNFHSVALVIFALLGLAHPYIAALLTRSPSWLTGIITMTLAAASGLVGELVAAPDNYDWHKALGTALTAWLLALGAHFSQLSGTGVQARLHEVGTKPAKRPAPQNTTQA